MRRKVVVLLAPLSQEKPAGFGLNGAFYEREFGPDELNEARNLVAAGRAQVQRSIMPRFDDPDWSDSSKFPYDDPAGVDEIVRRWEYPLTGGEIAMKEWLG